MANAERIKHLNEFLNKGKECRYYKVYGDDRCVLLHFNTKKKYGIDINAFQVRYGITTRYKNEQEVLFPLEQEYLVKEYTGTPNKFKYYLRKNELGIKAREEEGC